MNILHISRSMGQGGAQKIVCQLVENKSMNHYVISTGGVNEKHLESNNVRHIKIPDISSKNPFDIVRCFYIINKAVDKYEIDIIHSHHRMGAFHARLVKLINKKVQHVYTAHNIFLDKVRLMRFALKGAEVVAVGNGVKKNLIDIYNIKNVNVIYNSIEHKPYNNNNENSVLNDLKEKGSILIGNIGRLSEQKGMDIFIKSLIPIIEKNKKIFGVIVGDGEDREYLKELVRDYNIENNIVFLGYQTHINEIMKQLDLIVLSSRWEGFPLTPIEAFSNEKLVIASDISGNNEIIIEGYNGILFEKDNDSELTDKINYILANRQIKSKIEENAKYTFNKKYSYDVFQDKYNKLYKGLGEKSENNI